MSAVQHLLLYLRKLLSALRDPLNRSLRRLLQLWALLRIHILSSRKHNGDLKKPVQETEELERLDKTHTIICASSAPTQLSTIMGGGTPISPIPIHAHLTPYAYTNSNGSISSQNLDEDAASHNAEDFSRNPARDPYRNSRGGYFPDQLRPQSRASSRAPSSFRNSLMGAEDSALRGMYTIGPVIAPSRSVSPASTQYMNVHHNNLGAEDIALQRLGTPASTRPPSRTQNVIPNLKAHSMVDLRHAKPFHTSFAETSSRPGSRARSRSREPRSRLRSPSAMHGRSRSRTPMAFSGGHFGPQHGAASPAPCTAAPCSPSPTPDSEPVPEIRPCTAVARYDRNVTMYEPFVTFCYAVCLISHYRSQDITPQHVIPSLTVSYT